ncbi:MAG: type II secretion system protein [Cyanobacteria bacterium SIG30]|nr:type II secretion system protein [Cyanobacteria bacterium SIG30]
MTLISGGGASRSLKAFTLAEVLITLAIIGVVAALTIPSVITNYKKTELESKIKTAYSILSTALNLAIKDYGPTDTWDITKVGTATETTEQALKKYFIPYLKVAKECGKSQEPECVYEFSSLGGGIFVNANTGTTPHYSRIYLTNGTVIQMVMASNNNKVTQLAMLVDVNGLKKPNQLGVDIQYFVIPTRTVENQPKLNYQVAIASAGGNSDYISNITHNTKGCKKSLTKIDSALGTACTYVLRKNGWKIPSVDEYVEMAGGDEQYRALYPWNF